MILARRRLHRVTRLRPALFIAVAAMLGSAGAATVAPGPNPARAALSADRAATLAGVGSFAFAIGREIRTSAQAARLRNYDLVIADGQLTPAKRVAQLRAQGSVVLAYLSVGTIEPYRPWYRALRRYRLPDRFEEFDEDYARVNAPGFRRAIASRIAPRILAKGFDGLFLDNTDMIEGHGRQTRGMRALVRRLAGLVHGRGGLLFSQNGERTIGPLLEVYDGWNREDVTSTYRFDRHRYVRQGPAAVRQAQRALRRIGAQGLLVTATDYTAAGAQAPRGRSIANACSAGALPFVSNIGLTRLPLNPPACP